MWNEFWALFTTATCFIGCYVYLLVMVVYAQGKAPTIQGMAMISLGISLLLGVTVLFGVANAIHVDWDGLLYPLRVSIAWFLIYAGLVSIKTTICGAAIDFYKFLKEKIR